MNKSHKGYLLPIDGTGRVKLELFETNKVHKGYSLPIEGTRRVKSENQNKPSITQGALTLYQGHKEG
jgi:hypothetical protein